MNQFERFTREITAEINGQYPRPWMTDMKDPSKAEVFIVGYNPATAFRTDSINYERFIDSLLNRNGEGCRKFYAEVRRASPTRGNIEDLTDRLARVGVRRVIETNVICYGAAKKRHLQKPEHVGGKERGREIFQALLREVRPKAIVVHGKGVRDEFNRTLGLRPGLPPPPKTKDTFEQLELESGSIVFVIPPLGMPGFQNWPPRPLKSFCNWANEYLDEVSSRVAAVCAA